MVPMAEPVRGWVCVADLADLAPSPADGVGPARPAPVVATTADLKHETSEDGWAGCREAAALYLVVDRAGTIIRDSPSPSARPLGEIKQGSIVEVWPEREGAWLRLTGAEEQHRVLRGCSGAWIRSQGLVPCGGRHATGELRVPACLFQLSKLRWSGDAAVAAPTAPRECSDAEVGASLDEPSVGTHASTIERPPGHSVLQEVRHVLTPPLLQALRRDGFVVVDGALSVGTCAQLRDEMRAVDSAGMMWTSSTYGGSASSVADPQDPQQALRSAQHISPVINQSIVEGNLLHSGNDASCAAPTFKAICEDEGFLALMRQLVPGLALQELRLQINRGRGGCYGLHTDGDVLGEHDNGLRVTALFYLNEGWAPGDGGELLVYPFPQGPVCIEPLNGRLVVFDPAMVHGVLPCRRERFCFTLWLHTAPAEAGLQAGASCLPPQALQSLPPPLRYLLSPWSRPSLLRCLHHDAWELLIRLSHPPEREETAQLLASLGAHVEEARVAVASPWALDLYSQVQRPWDAVAGDAQAGASANGSKLLSPTQVAELVRSYCPYWSVPVPRSPRHASCEEHG